MFNKNINSITNKNNSGFKQLMLETRFDNTQTQIQAYQAKSGHYIILKNNIPLDSHINPIEETKQIYEEKIDKSLSSSDIVVIFGLGLGYLLKRIFIETQAKILLFEPDVNVLRFALEFVDFSEILTSNRIIISSDKKYILSKINELYFENTKINMVFNDEYLKIYTKLLQEFSSSLIDEVNSKKSDIITIRSQSKLWVQNILNNIPHYKDTRPINYLKNKFSDLPALILSAGPSLKDNLTFIKNNQNNFLIFAVNKISDFLIKNDIIPDFVVASDSYNLEYSLDFNNPQYKNINFILSAKCATNSFNSNNNSIWLYYPKNSSLIKDVINKTDDDLLFEKTSSTTSIYAYECAKIMGCKNIVFAGLDLAYRGNEHYSDNVEKLTDDIETKIKFTKVKNILGEMVQTRNDYALFIKQFENTLFENTDTNVYNLTSFGALIEGMEYLKAEEVLNKIKLQEKSNINQIIDSIKEKTKQKWRNTYEQINNLFDDYYKDIQQIDFQSIKNNYNSFEKIDFPKKYYEISINFIDFIKRILKNPILAEYFQNEILEYLNKFENLTINSNEQFVSLKNSELQFIKEIEKFNKY